MIRVRKRSTYRSHIKKGQYHLCHKTPRVYDWINIENDELNTTVEFDVYSSAYIIRLWRNGECVGCLSKDDEKPWVESNDVSEISVVILHKDSDVILHGDGDFEIRIINSALFYVDYEQFQTWLDEGVNSNLINQILKDIIFLSLVHSPSNPWYWYVDSMKTTLLADVESWEEAIRR